MTPRKYPAVLLAGLTLVTAVLAQEAQPAVADGSKFHIYQIYLAGTVGNPVSLKVSVEHVESSNGTKISKHWTEEWARDQQGRVWGRLYAPQEQYPEKRPPLAVVWLFDPAAGKNTICQVPEKECQVSDNSPAPYPVSFFAVGGSTEGCLGEVCRNPELQERIECRDERFQQKYLGEYSIGGITLGRTRAMCYKPDGSGVGAELWHNSEFDIYFDVYREPPPMGATHFQIDRISSSVPNDPKLFQIPPNGYSFK